MDASLSSPLSGRPRLVPGVPAGGIAAVAVTLGIVAWGLIAGSEPEPGDRSFRVEFDAPRPPLPPKPPAAPSAPRIVGHAGHAMPEVEQVRREVERAMAEVDVQAIRSEVERAMAEVDMEAVRRDALRAVDEATRALSDGNLAQLRALEQLEGLQKLEGLEKLEALKRLEVLGGAESGAVGDGGSLSASFDAPNGIRLIDLRGDVTVEVRPGADRVRLEVDEHAGDLRNSVRDGVLTLVGRGDAGRAADIRLYVPETAPLTVVGLVGDVTLGAGYAGDLDAEIRRGDITAESVGSATVKVMENGDVHFVRVDRKLAFSVYGNGELSAEQVGEAAIEIAGHGEVSLADVAGPLALSIPGHATVHAETVRGPARIAFMGAGEVEIGHGLPALDVAVMGSGSVRYNGTVDSPAVFMGGSGRVDIERATGTPRVQRMGSGSVNIGE